MSLVHRIKNITKATYHDLARDMEDPLKYLETHITELSKKLHLREKLYIETNRHYQALQKQYLQAEEMSLKREKQAFIAVKAGEENLARLLLQEKAEHEQKLERYGQLVEQSRESLLLLEGQLKELRQEMKEALAQRQYYKDLKGVVEHYHETISFQKR